MKPGTQTTIWIAVSLTSIALIAVQLSDDHDANHQQGHRHGHQHDSSVGPERIFNWSPDRIHTLLLTVNGQRMGFNRQGVEQWTFDGAEQPDALEVNQFLSLLSEARSDRKIDKAQHTISEYGLKHPHLTISLSDNSGNSVATIEIGDKTPDGFGRYVRLDGQDQVLIVPNYQFSWPLKVMTLNE